MPRHALSSALTRVLILTAIALSGFTAPTAARAEYAMRFDITVSGLKAGTFSLSATHKGGSYAVSSRATSSGLAGLFRSFSMVSKVVGRESGDKWRPSAYSARSEGSRAGRAAELQFRDGVPRVLSAAAEPDPDAPKLDPSTLRNVVDPLTGLYAVLRDTTADRACKLDLTLFDGHRVSRVTLSRPTPTADGMLCSGVYRRVAGYPARDLAQRESFEFTVEYVNDSERLTVHELTMNSLFGPARMTRN